MQSNKRKRTLRLVAFAALVLSATTLGHVAFNHRDATQRVSRTATPGAPAAASDAAAIVLPSPDSPAAEVFRRLTPLAGNGSAAAACRVAQEAIRCSSIDASLDLAEALAAVPKAIAPEGMPTADDIIGQADAASARCAGASKQTIRNAYAYQKIAAASGERRYQRWLVAFPGLDQEHFLRQLADWNDYSRRAKAYVANALRERRADDLAMLLAIHAPAQLHILRPPYQVDDPVTFLALAEIARRRQMDIGGELEATIRRVQASASPDEREQVRQKLVALSAGWSDERVPAAIVKLYETARDDAFCR